MELADELVLRTLLAHQVFDRVVDNGRELRTVFQMVRSGQFAGVVLVSDTESWVCRGRPYGYGARGASGVMTEWQQFVTNQLKLGGHDIPAPQLVCIDLQAYTTSQAPECDDILNIRGFSDAVFNVVASFLREVESAEL